MERNRRSFRQCRRSASGSEADPELPRRFRLSAAVQLSDDEASESDCALEFARLVERVAVRCCINHQQGFMRPDEEHRYHLQETTCDEAKHVFVKPLRELQRYKRYTGGEGDGL
jgi:hypothetical protein